MTLKLNRMMTIVLAIMLFLSLSGCVPYYPAYSYNRGYSVYNTTPYGYYSPGYAPGYYAPGFGFGFRGGYGHGYGHGFHGHHFGGGHFGGHHGFH